LKEKRAKLKPLIADMRALRQESQGVEEEYLDKKASFESTTLGLDSERQKLEADVNGLKTSVQEQESSYHFLHCLSTIAQVSSINARVYQSCLSCLRSK
jgi:hypothetical protein